LTLTQFCDAWEAELLSTNQFKCSKCGQTKPAEDFGKDGGGNHRGRNRDFGRSYQCKFCIAEAVKRYTRYNLYLPAYAEKIRSWPAAQLDSEADFLLAKLELVSEQRAARKRRAKR
jgi:hypothetical protein